MTASIVLSLAAALGFGAAMVFTRVGLRYMEPAPGALVSIPTTAALYWLLAPLLLDWDGWIWLAAGIFAGVGLFFPALVTMLVFESNRRMGPTAAGTVSCTAPLFATAGAVLVLGESLTPPVAAGTAAIVIGVMVLSSREKGGTNRWPRWTLALPLAAAAIRGLAQAATKMGLLIWPNPFAAGLIGYTVSSATVLAANRSMAPGGRMRIARRGVPWFMLTGIANGAAVFSLYAALRHGQVTLVSPIVATYPVFTLLFCALFLREERLSWRLAAGVALTVCGVAVLAAG